MPSLNPVDRGRTPTPQARFDATATDSERRVRVANAETEGGAKAGAKAGLAAAKQADTLQGNAEGAAGYAQRFAQQAGSAANTAAQTVRQTATNSAQAVANAPATTASRGGLARGTIVGVLIGLGGVAAAALVAAFIPVASVPAWGMFALVVGLGVAIAAAFVVYEQRQGAISAAPTATATPVHSHAQMARSGSVAREHGSLESASTWAPNPAPADLHTAQSATLQEHVEQVRSRLDQERQDVIAQREQTLGELAKFNARVETIGGDSDADSQATIAQIRHSIAELNAASLEINKRSRQLTQVAQQGLSELRSTNDPTANWKKVASDTKALKDHMVELERARQPLQALEKGREDLKAQAQSVLEQHKSDLAKLEKSAKAIEAPAQLFETFEAAAKAVGESIKELGAAIEAAKAVEDGLGTTHSTLIEKFRSMINWLEQGIANWPESNALPDAAKLNAATANLDELHRQAQHNVRVETNRGEKHRDIVKIFERAAAPFEELKEINVYDKDHENVEVTRYKTYEIKINETTAAGKRKEAVASMAV